MNLHKTIGWLLIAGAVGVFIPYTILTITFQYPDVLRLPAADILTRFQQGGTPLILTWWAFAMLGIPLLIAYVLIGKWLAGRVGYISWVTTLGVISGVVQIIGLLRWVFVVPVLARNFLEGSTVAAKEAALSSFQTVHQFGGVLLGEHLGQLFTIAWTVGVSVALFRIAAFPKWLSLLGIAASAIYLLAQAVLFATVIPHFPIWNLAGLIGSTLWLLWLIVTGIFFIKFGRRAGVAQEEWVVKKALAV